MEEAEAIVHGDAGSDAAEVIERARVYFAGVQSGRIVLADEVSKALADHLGALLDVIDDQYIAHPAPEGEQARRRDELLAQVPVSLREYALTQATATDLARAPGDTILTVTDWLRAARRGAAQ